MHAIARGRWPYLLFGQNPPIGSLDHQDQLRIPVRFSIHDNFTREIERLTGITTLIHIDEIRLYCGVRGRKLSWISRHD